MKKTVLVVALVSAVLGVLPAQASNGINNATYAARYRALAPEANIPKAGRGVTGARLAHAWTYRRPYAVKSH